MERFEDAFAFDIRNARPAIGNLQDAAALAIDEHARFNAGLTMLQGVLEQVADQPAQQPRIASHLGGNYVELNAEPGGFLGEENRHVHVLVQFDPDRFQLACEEDFLEMLVDLRTVLADALQQLGARCGVVQLQCKPDACQWRTQLVRCVGQHAAMRRQEDFDAIGHGVEAGREPRDFIRSGHRGACRQHACTETVHARRQRLDLPGQAAHQRINRQPHRQRNHDDDRQAIDMQLQCVGVQLAEQLHAAGLAQHQQPGDRQQNHDRRQRAQRRQVDAQVELADHVEVSSSCTRVNK